MKYLGIFLMGLCLMAACEARKSYRGYKVLSTTPTTKAGIEFLRHLMVTHDELDFWKEPSRLGHQVDIMVGPGHVSWLMEKLVEAGLGHWVKFDDVQDHIDQVSAKNRNTPDNHIFNINDFNTLDDINSWLQAQTTQCAAGVICQFTSIGSSYEGRPINVFKISKTGSGRRAYWIDSTIHAREWISTATMLQMIDNFVSQGDANAVDLVDRYDWIFLPVQNPDGYDYTWTTDRLWRKNRRPNPGSVCEGTDLNRNFNFRWGNEGVSTSPCSETYCGPSGGSEPETQATQNEFNRLGPVGIIAMVTMHAYGNMWMYPWGNTVNYGGGLCERTDDYAELLRVSNAAADAIQNTYNTQWARGTSCEVIYPTTGGTDDYAKGVPGIVYPFCPELRGNSFVISADQIPLSFNEIWNGIVAMVNAIGA